MNPIAPAIVRTWKRALFVGCSHGSAIRPAARAAIVEAVDRWKPSLVCHLGDWSDTTAFRAGAGGTKDETAPIRPDIDAGLQFLTDIRATLVFFGNHEKRITVLQKHPKALLAEAAQATIDRIRARCALNLCQLVESWPAWRMVGGYKVGHGLFFNENYLRDTAEAFGPSIVAHGHRAGVATGRRDDNPQCYGVGALVARDADEMTYSKARRSTLAWSGGFVWGEFCDDAAQWWLHDNGQAEEWRLPI